MKITDVRIRIGKGTEREGKLRAFADITFDESFVVHGLKVIEGKNGFFVAMPSRKTVEGDYKDIVHPIKTELRQEITKTILEYYEKENQKTE